MKFLRTQWVLRDGRLYIRDAAAVAPSDRFDLTGHPQPWEQPLTGAAGQRVVLAAATAYAGRLSALLPAAERAAQVADRYNLSIEPMGRYVIYLTGSADFRRWFGRNSERAIGYAVSTKYNQQIVIDLDRTPAEEVEAVFRHELGHIATMRDPLKPRYLNLGEHAWLTEGIAEYIAYQHQPVNAYPRLDSVRQYVRSGGWDASSLPVGVGRLSAAEYGLAYLAVRCLADTYTEPKMLDFFRDVARADRQPEPSALNSLGAPWPQVQQTCTAWMRHALN